MARIKELPSENGTTRYQARVRLRGFPSVSKTFTRKTDATKWASRVETEMREGRYFKNARAMKQTLGELIDRYDREILSRRKGGGVRNDKAYLAWWKAQLGSYSLQHITPALIVEKGRVRYLDDNERERLLEACQHSQNSQLYLIVFMAICTGCRKNELLTLKWSEVDFERQRIILNHTKNGERCSVPIRGKALPVRVWMRKGYRAVPRPACLCVKHSKEPASPLYVQYMGDAAAYFFAQSFRNSRG